MTETMERAILDETTKKNIDQWLSGTYDEDSKAIIRKQLKENPKEAIDAFYTKLSFGTGGLRGIMGIGCNRLNQYTIKTATQGLANYIRKQPKGQKGYSVFIGYDSRLNSRYFAEITAKVLAGNDIHVYLFKDLRPTPLLSFACRMKHCNAAIMITASHNPPEYNGYKVYWEDGAQILPPHDVNIIEEVNKIVDISTVKEVETVNHPLIEIVHEEVDEAYLKGISSFQHYPQINHEYGNKLKIAYTSLHGTGITLIPKVLNSWGFKNIVYEEKQSVPDGNFPTIKSSNPEDKSAFDLGLNLLDKTQGDILLATDADADRVGVVVRHLDGKVFLTGNQLACICLAHICEALANQGRMPENAAFAKTIVTTELFQAIANAYHKPCINVLTGFKYIAEKIRQWEQDPQGYAFVFGGEESYGYLLGTLCRDKDALISSALICEVALQCQLKGKTLVDMLYEIYTKYGVYYDDLNTLSFSNSKEGMEQIDRIVRDLLSNPPQKINGKAVVVMDDYFHSQRKHFKNGVVESITLPKSPVFIFWLEDGSKVAIRPSGTEPKIKLYVEVVDKKFDSVPEALKDCKRRCEQLLVSLKEKLLGKKPLL